MAYSLKRYRLAACRWLIPFVLWEVLIILLFATNIVNVTCLAIVSLANAVFLFLPGLYFLVMFWVFRRKSANAVPRDGVITNWGAGFYRYTGRVVIQSDGNTYATSAYFSADECQALVGTAVSYAIIDETLFLYALHEAHG